MTVGSAAVRTPGTMASPWASDRGPFTGLRLCRSGSATEMQIAKCKCGCMARKRRRLPYRPLAKVVLHPLGQRDRHGGKGGGAMKLITHRGGCHCGQVRFEVDAPEDLELETCNCSICEMTGFLHHVVPRARFRLRSGHKMLAGYRFHTKTAVHPFCKACGVRPFLVPRAYPDGISVNANCLDGDTVRSRDVVRRLDGQNWERRLTVAYDPTAA